MTPAMPSPGRRGFTLMEILIATCILGVALVAILDSFRHSVSMYRLARDTSLAATLASTLLQDSLPNGKDDVHERQREAMVEGHPRFRYRLNITRVPLPGVDEDLLPKIYRVELSVLWTNQVERRVTLVQYVNEKGDSGL